MIKYCLINISLRRKCHCFVGDKLFSKLYSIFTRQRFAFLSLFYRYFHWKWLNKLHSLVPPVLNNPTKGRNATHIVAYIVIFFFVFHSTVATFHEPLLCESDSDHYNLNLIKFRANGYRPHLSAKPVPLILLPSTSSGSQ